MQVHELKSVTVTLVGHLSSCMLRCSPYVIHMDPESLSLGIFMSSSRQHAWIIGCKQHEMAGHRGRGQATIFLRRESKKGIRIVQVGCDCFQGLSSAATMFRKHILKLDYTSDACVWL